MIIQGRVLTVSQDLYEQLRSFPEKHMYDQDKIKELKYLECQIFEQMQPEEETQENEDLLFGLDNSRWITVEQDDAGDYQEEVLFRTFVDAAIGGKARRVRSKGAPYLLMLYCKDGESELKVVLCNQSSTLCLSRNCKLPWLSITDLVLIANNFSDAGGSV